MTTPKKILIQDLELSDKEIKRLREENRKLKAELENFSESYKRYRDFSKQELADSLYDSEEQNKSLKNELMEDMKTETKLNEEIKKLKSREEKLIAYYKWYVDKEHNLTEVEDIITENIKLKERIIFLEQCLDNKEKVNISLREDIGKLVIKE